MHLAECAWLARRVLALCIPPRFVSRAWVGAWQVWELVYSRDGAVKEVPKVMQLKGHKVGRAEPAPGDGGECSPPSLSVTHSWLLPEKETGTLGRRAIASAALPLIPAGWLSAPVTQHVNVGAGSRLLAVVHRRLEEDSHVIKGRYDQSVEH